MDVGQLVLAAVGGGVGGALGALIGRRMASSASDSAVAARRQSLSIGLVAGGAAVLLPAVSTLLGVTDWINVALGAKSRVDVIASQETAMLTSHPKFRALVNGKSLDEARAATAALTSRGIAYLDLADLQEWARIKLKLAERSPSLCAQMWNGNLDSASFMGTLGQLPERDIRSWMRLTATAGQRVLDEAIVEPATPDAVRQGLEEILRSVSADKRDALRRDMAMGQGLDEARACGLMKLVLRESRGLPPELQLDFLRVLSRGYERSGTWVTD